MNNIKKLSVTIQFLALLIIISFHFSSCREKDPQPQDLGFISLGEAKDYMLFKPGTWWVYKNTWTNELDTMVLTYCQLDTFHAASSKRVFDYEDIAFQIYSLRDKATYFTFSRGISAEVLNFYAGWYWETERIGSESKKYYSQNGIASRFFFPPKTTGSISNGSYRTSFIENIDSAKIKNKYFYDILHFYIESDNTFPYPNQFILEFGKSHYYWARGIGIVKIEHISYNGSDLNNEVKMNWEIIESHIYK